MFIELIAVIFAGLACAGMAMLLNRVTGGRLPRWIVPVAAAVPHTPCPQGMRIQAGFPWKGPRTSSLRSGSRR